MLKMFDYECNACEERYERLIRELDEKPPCPACNSVDVSRLMAGGHLFTTIVPTTLTSKRYKAGYAHHFNNKPAEKISVSVPSKVGSDK